MSISSELPCYRCGYDVRAHPRDGNCPECGGSVAEASRWAAVPRRPAWKDSDRRWRRRILAGIWLLVLIPLMDVLQKSGWAAHLFVPTIWRFGPNSLDDTFLAGVYPHIVFWIGAVLLFSRERGRRASQLDWTRRWGILCSYIVAMLVAAIQLFVPALVMVGISALFLDLPVKYQPRETGLFVELSTRYLRYGPYPRETTYCVLVMFSSATILLACAPLWEALCSRGPKLVARIMLAPVALFALLNIAQAGKALFSPPPWDDPFYYLQIYFRPVILVWKSKHSGPQGTLLDFEGECVKWFAVFAIAVWLSVAQVAAWRAGRRKKG